MRRRGERWYHAATRGRVRANVAHHGGSIMSHQKRREFLGKVAFGIAGASVGPAIIRKSFAAAGSDMPYRTLGRTGEKVSLLGLGGFHIGIQKTEAESIRIIQTAIDNGVNFLD